jgi:hypothetical protein
LAGERCHQFVKPALGGADVLEKLSFSVEFDAAAPI